MCSKFRHRNVPFTTAKKKTKKERTNWVVSTRLDWLPCVCSCIFVNSDHNSHRLIRVLFPFSIKRLDICCYCCCYCCSLVSLLSVKIECKMSIYSKATRPT